MNRINSIQYKLKRIKIIIFNKNLFNIILEHLTLIDKITLYKTNNFLLNKDFNKFILKVLSYLVKILNNNMSCKYIELVYYKFKIENKENDLTIAFEEFFKNLKNKEMYIENRKDLNYWMLYPSFHLTYTLSVSLQKEFMNFNEIENEFIFKYSNYLDKNSDLIRMQMSLSNKEINVRNGNDMKLLKNYCLNFKNSISKLNINFDDEASLFEDNVKMDFFDVINLNTKSLNSVFFSNNDQFDEKFFEEFYLKLKEFKLSKISINYLKYTYFLVSFRLKQSSEYISSINIIEDDFYSQIEIIRYIKDLKFCNLNKVYSKLDISNALKLFKLENFRNITKFHLIIENYLNIFNFFDLAIKNFKKLNDIWILSPGNSEIKINSFEFTLFSLNQIEEDSFVFNLILFSNKHASMLHMDCNLEKLNRILILDTESNNCKLINRIYKLETVFTNKYSFNYIFPKLKVLMSPHSLFEDVYEFVLLNKTIDSIIINQIETNIDLNSLKILKSITFFGYKTCRFMEYFINNFFRFTNLTQLSFRSTIYRYSEVKLLVEYLLNSKAHNLGGIYLGIKCEDEDQMNIIRGLSRFSKLYVELV